MEKRSFVALLLAIFISLLGIGIIIPVLPVFAASLGASGFDLGLIMAAFSVSRGLLQPFVGNWSDRWGRKGFLITGLGIYGLVGLLTPLASSITMLIFIRFLHGIGSAMIGPVVMAYMSQFAPSGQEGRYQSYLNAAVFCGIGCGPMIGGVLSDNWGMPSVFYGMALMSFIAMLLVMFTLPGKAGREGNEDRRLFATLRIMRRDTRTLGILLARFSTMLVPVPLMAFLPLYMASWDGESYSGFAVGMVIACRTLVNAGLQVPFGRLADRWNRERMLLLGSLTLVVLFFCIPFCRTFHALMLVYLLIGTAEALIWAVLGALASVEAKNHYGHGTMMGIYALSMSCGVFCGAVLSGSSMDWLGIDAAYRVVGGSVLVLICVALWMMGRKRVEETAAD
ncbi:MFS transporter [Desulforhopalus vacuolatus]|uniref:MFS transporter n=1 Tax=Desulforhopalus vacuolatus TaxID=40414 RepID=UPI0019658231|nr:MFS transporter [Desulforhopalus vacuolatus]MBM9520143.1 MFS transporter [Desulforhopalus vacuolatus]